MLAVASLSEHALIKVVSIYPKKMNYDAKKTQNNTHILLDSLACTIVVHFYEFVRCFYELTGSQTNKNTNKTQAE